jgi:hypothetical protein
MESQEASMRACGHLNPLIPASAVKALLMKSKLQKFFRNFMRENTNMGYLKLLFQDEKYIYIIQKPFENRNLNCRQLLYGKFCTTAEVGSKGCGAQQGMG